MWTGSTSIVTYESGEDARLVPDSVHIHVRRPKSKTKGVAIGHEVMKMNEEDKKKESRIAADMPRWPD